MKVDGKNLTDFFAYNETYAMILLHPETNSIHISKWKFTELLSSLST